MATWFQNLFSNGEHSNSSSSSGSSSKPFKQTHFNVVNLSTSLIGVRVFNEDPDEVLCDTSGDDFGPEDSDFLNGFEPISLYKSLQVGHQYTYKSTSGCADSHVGTVVVESLGCTYYVFAQQMVTAFLDEGEDPSSLIISQKEDPMELSSSANDCKEEEEERIKVVILDEKDKIVVTLVVTNADETTRSLSDSEEGEEIDHGDLPWHMSHGTLDLTISELESDFFEPPTAARSKYRRSAKYLSSSPLRIPTRPQPKKQQISPQPQLQRQKSPDKITTKRPLLSRRNNGTSGRSLSSRSSSSSSLPQEKQQQQHPGSLRRTRSRRAAIPNVIADDSSSSSSVEESERRRLSDSAATLNNSSSNSEKATRRINSYEKATRRTAMANLSSTMDNDDSDRILQETATRTDANEKLYSGQLAW